MSIKSALFAAITTVVLILALGNEWAVEQARDAGETAIQTRASIVGQLRFQFWELPSEIRGPSVVHLVLLVVLAAVFGGIVGRARPLAAFIGGWSAFLAAAVVSAGVYGLILDDRYGGYSGSGSIDTFTGSASIGASLGMWLGWLVGLAVMLGSLGGDRAKTGGAGVGAGAPPAAWTPPPNPAGSFDPPPAPHHPGGSVAPPAAPAPPAPGGPVIGTPPDRTQVFGEPPARDTP
jgi:hypothetical protein